MLFLVAVGIALVLVVPVALGEKLGTPPGQEPKSWEKALATLWAVPFFAGVGVVGFVLIFAVARFIGL